MKNNRQTCTYVTFDTDNKKYKNYLCSINQTIIILQREILTISADAEDEGTNALMSDYIREQEKLVWMYSSYLNK